MSVYEGALADLVEEFGKLPGIGPKSAQRLAFYVMQSPREDVDSLISALTNVKTHVRFCDQCGIQRRQQLDRILGALLQRWRQDPR